MSKTMSILLAILLAVSLLAACGGDGALASGGSVVSSSGAAPLPMESSSSEVPSEASVNGTEGIAVYQVGNQYSVDIPDGEGLKISQIDDRVTIVDADKRWVLLLTYSTKAEQTPEEYMQGVDVPPDSAQPYSAGNISGFRYQRETSDGQVYKVAVVFNSLAEGEAHVGIIELEINYNLEGGDAAVFFDEPVVQDIIGSIRAPE